jgi:hypothetical protein
MSYPIKVFVFVLPQCGFSIQNLLGIAKDKRIAIIDKNGNPRSCSPTLSPNWIG